jgi:hypothetical protein
MDSFDQLQKNEKPSPENKCSQSSQQCRVLLFRGLPRRNGPNEDAKYCLGDDVCYEYPTCSYVVATVPARPMFLMMYTKG